MTVSVEPGGRSGRTVLKWSRADASDWKSGGRRGEGHDARCHGRLDPATFLAAGTDGTGRTPTHQADLVLGQDSRTTVADAGLDPGSSAFCNLRQHISRGQ